MKRGVYFDYKKKYRGFLGWNIVAATVSLLLAISTYNVYQNIQEKFTPIQTAFFFISYIFQHFGSATVLTNYVILIFCLHRRFDCLNTLLRLLFCKHKISAYFFTNILPKLFFIFSKKKFSLFLFYESFLI